MGGSMTKKRKRGIISEAFYIMELPIKFATEVTDDFISDTVSFIDPRRGRKKRRGVSTNY
jgi:hypothetical protein